MATKRKVGNLLAVPLLTMLTERPMYPYEMASTLRERGKDQAIKINWGSFYTVVQNLEKHGFIEAVEVDREGRQPERTTYRLTDAGRAELTDWLSELLRNPVPQHSTLEVALADCAVLGPDAAVRLLTERLAALDEDNAKAKDNLAHWAARLPRLFLIENEFHVAMRIAEAEWVRGLLRDLTDGTMPGIDAWRTYHETGQLPDMETMLAGLMSRDAPEGGPDRTEQADQ